MLYGQSQQRVLCNECISELHYLRCVIVFDGYDSGLSIKEYEHV